MATVGGVEKLIMQLRDRAASARRGGTLVDLKVGYSADYAIFVHEDMTKRHANGQAKYLEQPARTEANQMSYIIRTALTNGKSLREALQDAGDHLLAVSQQLVPVDTGALRASGYVQVS